MSALVRPYRIFVSSVQKELAKERRAVQALVEQDPLLRRFFSVFLFEHLPAADQRPDTAYLHEVDRCDVYLAILGLEYGGDGKGISPTELEFDRATEKGKERLVYLTGADSARQPKMLALTSKAGSQLMRRRVADVGDLTAKVQASLVEFLVARGAIQTKPFDDRPCPGASISDIDPAAVAAFVSLARTARQFPLAVTAPVADVLTHLRLLPEGRPSNAAILLFGRDPAAFHPAAEVGCMHFHDTEIVRPAPFHRTFKGTLFQQVDQAVDFVLSKLDISVGTRTVSAQAPTRVEIPRDVIAEAIVNAVAHRDYTVAGAVQVSVFSDRVEVWNPGNLPAFLPPESLSEPHGSFPRNPRVCDPLFLAGYIEKFGTGTLMMIRESLAHALPAPEFVQRGAALSVIVWRDWLTVEVVRGLALNDRQTRALAQLKVSRLITNSGYQQLVGCPQRTATRDLRELVEKGVLTPEGSGRGARYHLARKRAKNAPSAPSGSAHQER